MKPSTLALGISLLALIAVSGCGSTKTDTSTTPGATPTAGAKTKIVFIPKSAGNPYFTQVESGFKKNADQFGIDFSSQAPSSADATSQLAVIKDQAQRGEEVIVIAPNSPDALNEALDQVVAKGVIVITADSDLTGNESHRSVGVLPVDFTTIGPEQVELLGSQINYEGEIAILSATSDAPNQNAWIESMKTTLAEPKYAKMKLVEVVYGDDEPQKSTTETEALLTKHANLRGIIAPTSVGLAAAAQVLGQKEIAPGAKNAKNGGLVLTGLGTPNELRKAVKAGVVAKFQLWDPADIGTVAGYLGTQLKAKKLDLKVGTKFDVPGKGSFEIKEKQIVIAGKLVTFTKENIDQYQY
ncbi:MAG: substrate-binding domain-containing protein [Armatimonadetes bacterium]|nr:substrate-binding domain-containing protein [Armatimonadota bacterium]